MNVSVNDLLENYQKDSKYIDDVLKEGAERSNAIASKKVDEMKKIVGF